MTKERMDSLSLMMDDYFRGNYVKAEADNRST
jgi:hypothetical protein